MPKAQENDVKLGQDWLAARLDLLHRTNQAILAAHSTAEITRSALTHLMAMIPARRASVALFDHEQSLIHLADVLPDQSSGAGRGWQAPLHNVWFLEHLDHDEVVCDEHLEDARGSAWAEALREAGVVSFSAVPLMAKGALLGSLNVSLLSGQCLSEGDHEMLWQVADHLTVALEYERLRRELEEHAFHLEELVAQRTAKLRAASARFRVLFQQAPVGIAVVDTQGRIEMANPALAEISGYLASDLNALRLKDIVQENERTALRMRLATLFSGNKRPSHQEVRLLCKDGTLRWARTTFSLFNPYQAHTSALVMIQDIHEERASREALFESEKLTVMGRMAATLVHEINNPLQVVLGCLGLAEETAAEGQDVSRYLEVAHEELTRTAKIVARLRDMRNSDQGRWPTRRPT